MTEAAFEQVPLRSRLAGLLTGLAMLGFAWGLAYYMWPSHITPTIWSFLRVVTSLLFAVAGLLPLVGLAGAFVRPPTPWSQP